MSDAAPPHPTAGLLQAAQAGDRVAFDHLFARVTPRLRWYVGIRLGLGLRARIEPEDVLQETFAAAWTGLASFEDRGPGSFLRWMFTLAENQIRGLAVHHRAQRRDAGRTRPADTALAMAADPHTGPCTRAARVERRLQVARAMAQLEDNEREVLLARLVEGRTVAETAQRLGRSESSTRRLLASSSARLGRILEKGERA